MIEIDCEDQGYSLISDGCIPCQTWEPGATKPTRPALVQEARYGRLWWMCPKCHRSYGDAGPVTPNATVVVVGVETRTAIAKAIL